MSQVYNLVPPTDGKLVLHTSYGDVDIELWPKEVRGFVTLHTCPFPDGFALSFTKTPKNPGVFKAPLACRNFIQLALEGYYDNTIFHRCIHKFMIRTCQVVTTQ